ncbi:MAG: sigma-70 family RNA polymerase sigma factor [Bacteroidales bacterium]|nr:sigma-70 family RNA polymerase sigma factor [Bacteroidales bacterium]
MGRWAQVFSNIDVKRTIKAINLDRKLYYSLDNQQQIELLRKGDQKAFKLLVDQNFPKVYRTCLGIIHDRDDADDLAQDVFVEVFESLEKFRGDSALSTWLYRIAINKSLNYLRKKKISGLFKPFENYFNSDDKKEIQIAGPDSDGAGFHLENEEMKQMLNKALGALPTNQRVAFTLHKSEGLAYKQIGEIMKLSLSSVESLIHRAKKNLQTSLIEIYKEI